MALTAKPLSEVRSTVATKDAAKGETVRVNFNVSPETRNRWKIAAIERNLNLQDMITEAVEQYLKK